MWFWWILLAVGTFVIAAASVGGATGLLATRPRRSVYDLEEAVDFVADRLPDGLTATLSYDEVRAVLAAHCDYLAARGVASARADDEIGEDLVVVSDDEPLGWVIGQVEAQGLDLDDEAVAAVLEVEAGYYEAIGAIGPRVEGSGEPPGS